MLGFIQVVKVSVFRTLALLFAFDWALSARVRRAEEPASPGYVSGIRHRLRVHPGRWVIYAAVAVLVANVVSLSFSPVKSIGFWGIDVGWDTYGVYSILGYLVFFTVLVVKLRTRAQIDRLIWTLTGVSILVSLYAVAQHFGVDPLRNDPLPVSRAGSSFGNPIFGPSFLVMTIPLTIAAFLPYRDRMPALSHIWIGAGLISVQFTAIIFSVSRGPLAALVISLIALFVVIVWVQGSKAMVNPPRYPGLGWVRLPWAVVRIVAALLAASLAAVIVSIPFGPTAGIIGGEVAFLTAISWGPGGRPARTPAAMVLVATAITVVMALLPVVDAPGGLSFGERIANVGGGTAAGFNNRQTIWTTAWDVYTTVPWVDTDEFPTVPELGVPWLRPLVGYGPDMFGYAYPLAGDTVYTNELASHGHNFIVHTAIELGLIGVAAYLFLLGSVGVLLYRLLARARAGAYPDWFLYLVIGLAIAMVARIVEQIPGKAQVSDLQLMWVLAAFVVAASVVAPSLEGASDEPEPAPASRRERRRGGRRNVRTGAGPASAIRLVVAGVIAIMAAALWTQTVATVFAAHVVAANAREASDAGDSQRTVRLLRDATEKMPGSAVAKLNLASIFFTAGLQGERSIEERISFIEAADDLMLEILERNPLDHRGWSRHAEFLREIAVLDSSRLEEAVLAADALVNLMPGFWQPRTAQALSLVRMGFYEAGLEVVQEAKDIRVLESPGAQFIYFIEASAYEELGRVDDAIEAAHCSLAHQTNSNAVALLERLGAPPGDEFDLTDAEVERCPEAASRHS